MSKQLKQLRVSFMYWRFRHITSRRMRFQSWFRRKRPNSTYRPRASASYVYRRSPRRTWIALLILVAVLTAIGEASVQFSLSPQLVWIVNLVVIAGAAFLAVRYL